MPRRTRRAEAARRPGRPSRHGSSRRGSGSGCPRRRPSACRRPPRRDGRGSRGSSGPARRCRVPSGLDVGHEADTAGVVFVGGVVEALGGGLRQFNGLRGGGRGLRHGALREMTERRAGYCSAALIHKQNNWSLTPINIESSRASQTMGQTQSAAGATTPRAPGRQGRSRRADCAVNDARKASEPSAQPQRTASSGPALTPDSACCTSNRYAACRSNGVLPRAQKEVVIAHQAVDRGAEVVRHAGQSRLGWRRRIAGLRCVALHMPHGRHQLSLRVDHGGAETPGPERAAAPWRRLNHAGVAAADALHHPAQGTGSPGVTSSNTRLGARQYAWIATGSPAACARKPR